MPFMRIRPSTPHPTVCLAACKTRPLEESAGLRLCTLYFISALALFCLFCHPASALVIGTYGQLYEIREKDMRTLIEEKAQAFDFEKWKYEQSTRLSNSFSKFRPADAVSGLPNSRTGEAYKVDLTYTLPYDIYDVSGNIVYPKGFTYNPLELMQRQGLALTQIIVVLNGTRENELLWFKKKFADPRAGHIMLLLTDGYALELAEELERPVMYLSELLRAKLQIKETPSVVIQNNRELFLTVKPYALDANGKELTPPKRKGGR